MPALRLTSSDREFFGVLVKVVYGNAFAPDRMELIAPLVPGATPEALAKDEQALARVVVPRLEPFMRAGGLHAPGLSDADRSLLRSAFLYVSYIRALLRLDALIAQQAGKAGEPLPVPFADEVIGDLVRFGLGEEEAPRYLAFFFQLRRCFYFIRAGLAGRSPSMRRLREALWNNIFSHDVSGLFEAALWNRMEDFSTLLLGETGTGKGAVAAAIGRSAFIPFDSARRRFAANFTEIFIAINLSQYPETLIESELFGHRKGAFSGAIDHHEGVFARCNEHGALFLDEIGEVSIPVQIKLLQVLQERTFTPVGGREKKRFGGRVIAATNRPLTALREGRLRDDFFYRLCSDVIHVPTLRQRIAESADELEQLVQPLVTRTAGAEVPELVARVLETLAKDLPRDYPWPGNVRELEQAVRRILLTGHYTGEIAPAAGAEDEALMAELRAGTLTADELLARYSALLYARLGSYAEVAKRTGLDPRTARKYVESAKAS